LVWGAIRFVGRIRLMVILVRFFPGRSPAEMLIGGFFILFFGIVILVRLKEFVKGIMRYQRWWYGPADTDVELTDKDFSVRYPEEDSSRNGLRLFTKSMCILAGLCFSAFGTAMIAVGLIRLVGGD